MVQEKIMKLTMKALEIQRDVIFNFKEYKKEINKNLNSNNLKVISQLYNSFLLIYTYATFVFRNTKSIESFENFQYEISDTMESINDIGKEIKHFDHHPDDISITVRCHKDKLRKALKECDNVYKSLYSIGDWMNNTIQEFNDEDYKTMNKLVKIYAYRARALDTLMYSMLVLLKYREGK